MARIEKFEDIEAWQVALLMNQEFTKIVDECRTFTNPNLLDQMNRCLDSTMANIAEGFEARSDRGFVRYLNIATGSASEFQSHLYVARVKALIAPADFDMLYNLAKRTKSLIGGFRRYLLNCLQASAISKGSPKSGRRKTKGGRRRSTRDVGPRTGDDGGRQT